MQKRPDHLTLFCLALISCACSFVSCRHSSAAPAPAQTPTLQDDRLNELSGIASSQAHPGTFYVHNDSGDTSRFFSIGSDGHLNAVFYFKGDASSRLGVVDVEDIALSGGPEKGSGYVYLGDIGDNNAIRKYVTVFRIKEPALPAAGAAANVEAEPLFLKYPDGAHDAETLMADPLDQLLYIVSKREDSVIVYSTPLDFKSSDTVVLQKRAKLYFPGSGEVKWITAGDISQDGQQVLLKTYAQVFYWKRQPNEGIWQTLERSPSILPYTVEPQGEAIAFSLDGKSYYTVSEGVHAKLYNYKTPGN